MAFGSSSKIFTAFIESAMENTAAFNLASDTFKAALFNDTTTPSQTAAAASTAYNTGVWTTANELANGGWAVAGQPLATVTSALASNVYTFDAADTANSSAATLSNVFGCLVYDDTLASKQGVSYHSFGGTAQGVTSGTFTIVWNAAGILTLTL